MIAVIARADLVHLLVTELTVRCTLETKILRHSVPQINFKQTKKQKCA